MTHVHFWFAQGPKVRDCDRGTITVVMDVANFTLDASLLKSRPKGDHPKTATGSVISIYM